MRLNGFFAFLIAFSLAPQPSFSFGCGGFVGASKRNPVEELQHHLTKLVEVGLPAEFIHTHIASWSDALSRDPFFSKQLLEGLRHLTSENVQANNRDQVAEIAEVYLEFMSKMAIAVPQSRENFEAGLFYATWQTSKLEALSPGYENPTVFQGNLVLLKPFAFGLSTANPRVDSWIREVLGRVRNNTTQFLPEQIRHLMNALLVVRFTPSVLELEGSVPHTRGGLEDFLSGLRGIPADPMAPFEGLRNLDGGRGA